MKERIMKLLEAKKEQRKSLMESVINGETVEARTAANEALAAVDAEIENLNAVLSELDAPAGGEARGMQPGVIVGSQMQQPQGTQQPEGRSEAEVWEERGAQIRRHEAITVPAIADTEQRAQTIASGTIIVESKYSRTLNDKPNEVSSLIDRVNSVPLTGGESYTKGFVVSDGEGDYTEENADYNEADTNFEYVNIGKACITAYMEVSRSFQVLPNADYARYVTAGVRNALRKKITKQLITGAGSTNTIQGIYNAPEKCCPAASDVTITAIDADTLNTIVFALGGDEDVQAGAVLTLNKKDLEAFAKVRVDGKAVYKITKTGNTGTLGYADGGVTVDYIINSACAALSADGTAAAANTMVYGALDTYEMPVFSDITIEESKDYKFKQGIIAYRGDVYIGGGVAAYKSFIRVKKGA